MGRDTFSASYIYSDCLKPVIISPPQYGQEDRLRIDANQIFCHILIKYEFCCAASVPVTQVGKTTTKKQQRERQYCKSV